MAVLKNLYGLILFSTFTVMPLNGHPLFRVITNNRNNSISILSILSLPNIAGLISEAINDTETANVNDQNFPTPGPFLPLPFPPEEKASVPAGAGGGDARGLTECPCKSFLCLDFFEMVLKFYFLVFGSTPIGPCGSTGFEGGFNFGFGLGCPGGSYCRGQTCCSNPF
jgi:hypothetical protein